MVTSPEFASGVTELKEKLGAVNWQFMATKKFDAGDFEAFLKLLPKKVNGLAIRHAVEVRHDSFRDKAFVALCRRHGVATVFCADSDFPVIGDVTAGFVYVRIMGTAAKEKLAAQSAEPSACEPAPIAAAAAAARRNGRSCAGERRVVTALDRPSARAARPSHSVGE